MNTTAALPRPWMLKIVRREGTACEPGKQLTLSPGAPTAKTKTVRTAEKMVVACRENVRFLNSQLRRFESYLAIPPLVDNVLYLAYTLTVRETAPFDGAALRDFLVSQGIEASSAFSFTADAKEPIPLTQSPNDHTMCLPCHHYLTILDLLHIVESMEAFFSRRGLKGDPANADD